MNKAEIMVNGSITNLKDKNGIKNENKAKPIIECIRCGTIMSELTSCHLRCLKCGSELTCSDKGNFW